MAETKKDVTVSKGALEKAAPEGGATTQNFRQVADFQNVF